MINALKHPAFFRPASRPSSPSPVIPPSRPDSGVGFDRAARPLNKLSLSNFRRPSPAPAPLSVPESTPLVQDGSYLEMLSLKLSEAVSKALAQPTGPPMANEQLGGRRPIPAGRGHALGALIASELNASSDNPHLHRAIIRSLHRPLSVLLSNLSAHLLPLITSPSFLSPAAPTVQSPNPNPTQLHAMAFATFAGELLEVFDDFGLGLDADVRGDGLKAIREGLVSIVGRVVNPLVTGIRNDLMPLLEALEAPVAHGSTKTVIVTKLAPAGHPSIVALQALMPIYARALTRYTSTAASQTFLPSFLLCIIWRVLLSLSHRPFLPPSPPSSPALVPVSASISKRRGSSPGSPTVTPPANRFTIKLPPSRPPSPPSLHVSSTAAADARTLYDLLNLFPRPAADKQTRLAREAVDEAYNGLQSLAVFLEAVQGTAIRAKTGDDLVLELERLTADLPTLICLPILFQVYRNGDADLSIASLLEFSEDEYRKGCLAGYGRAEECASVVGHRVLEELQERPGEPGIDVIIKWLEAELAED